MKVALSILTFCLSLAIQQALAGNCAEKDSDYCEVDPTCRFDFSIFKCLDLSCSIYSDRTHCLADAVLSKVGPCTWDEQFSVCYQKDGQMPCRQYYYGCPTDRCNYDEATGTCYDKGSTVPCVHYQPDKTHCPSDHCTLEQGICIPTSQAKACSEHFESSSCNKISNCQWHDDIATCWPKDLQLPCDRYPDPSVCPTDRCTTYKLSQYETVCYPKDQPIPCERFESTDTCPKQRCQWNDGSSQCFNPDVGLDCHVYDRAACPSTTCKYIAGVCYDKNEPVMCENIAFLSSDCTPDNGCQNNCQQQVCEACQDCQSTKCGGVTPDPNIDCLLQYTEPDCSQYDKCVWNETLRFCLEKGKPIPCEAYTQANTCNAQTNRCQWQGNYCNECIDGHCDPPSTTASPDSGSACSTYNEMTCPYPRCIFTYDDQNQICRNTSCADMYDKNLCSQKDGCAYDDKLQACYKKSDGVPCSYFGDKQQCQAESDCVWSNDIGICGGKDTGKTCSSYSLEHCPLRCKQDYQANDCVDKDCTDFFQAQDCKKPCQWDNQTQSCYVDKGGACSKYTRYEDCPPTRCTFHFQDGDKGVCETKGCSDYFDKSACLGAGCKFIDDAQICYNDTGAACSSYPDHDHCPENRCEWYSKDGTSYSCVEKVCGDFFDKELCLDSNLGCTWQEEDYTCFKDTGLSCTHYDERTCPLNRCVYDPDFKQCRTPKCSDYMSEDQCLSTEHAPIVCSWNSTYSVCYIHGEDIPCEVFNYAKDSCPTDRCAWADDVEVCYPKGGRVLCKYIFDQSPCESRQYCEWDSDKYVCQTKPSLALE